MNAVRVGAEGTHDLRSRVLRPGLPMSECVFDGDDAASTLHAAVFDAPGGTPLGVGSVMESGEGAWQVRGMATDVAARGTGVGAAVLDALVAHADAHGARRVWCNARTGAVGFYAGRGWRVESEEFDIPGVGPHVVMSAPEASGPEVRDATHADIPAITAVYNQAVLTTTASYDVAPQPEEARRRAVDAARDEGRPVLVATDGGRVVGWATYGALRDKPGYRHTVEHSVYVDQEHRGGGVGTALIRHLIARATAADVLMMVGGSMPGTMAASASTSPSAS